MDTAYGYHTASQVCYNILCLSRGKYPYIVVKLRLLFCQGAQTQGAEIPVPEKFDISAGGASQCSGGILEKMKENGRGRLISLDTARGSCPSLRDSFQIPVPSGDLTARLDRYLLSI